MTRTSVFRVTFEVDRYQVLLYDLPEPGLDLWLFDGTSRAASWVPQPVYSDRPRLDIPDIWHLVGAAVMVMREEVTELLEPFVSMAGELLPLVLSGSGDIILALNVLQDIDCLNPESYSLDELQVLPDFLEHRLPESGLFKVPQLDTTEIFCVERDDDSRTVRNIIAENDLCGVAFELVWSSSTGAQPINLFDGSPL